MAQNIRIETERLLLRRFSERDAEDLYAILGDEEAMAYLEPAYDFAKTKRFLLDFCIRRNGAVAAEHKESRRVIGYLLFHETEPGEFELGWVFLRDIWRRGYAFEACRALIDDAFSRQNALRLFAQTTDSVRSVALMRKLDMRCEEVQRQPISFPNGGADLYRFVLTKADREAMRGPRC